MKNNRLERVNSELTKALAYIIDNDLRDPQITSMIGVSYVDVSPDLSYAKVYITVYGSQDKEEVLNRIKGAASHIRGKLAPKVRMRVIPYLEFFLDGTVEYGNKIDTILSNINYTTNPDDVFGEE